MRKIRILSLILALAMLTGAVMLLSSCKKEKDGIVSLSKKVIEVDVSDYALVYGESQTGSDYTVTFRDYFNAFAGMLSKKTGKKLSPQLITRAKTGAADKEILLGVTDRAESVAALEQIEGEGFVIRVTDNKIVILGTSNLFTLTAMNYFAEKYLEAASGATLSVNETALATEVGTLELASSDEAGYTYVYKDGIGELPAVYTPYKKGAYQEYPQVAAESIQTKMNAIVGLPLKQLPIKTDAEVFDKEVLIGMTGREESINALEGLDANRYVIATSGEKVVINAWNEALLQHAGEAYLDILTEGTVQGADGKARVVIPCNFRFAPTANENWVLNFPRPEGENIKLYNTMDANDNALQFLYTGDGVNAESYKAYCDQLKAAGYTVYMENAIEGSLFTTFVNDKEKICLYVAYNAYAHVSEYDTEYKWVDSKDVTKDPGCYEYDPCFRIVSSPLDDAGLVPQKLLSKQSYKKETDSAITTMPIYGKAVGLSYVVTLEDGSFVVFDGGGVGGEGALGNEHSILWSTLVALHKETYGAEPTRDNPVHIAAWVLTHGHWDHYQAFENLGKEYGQKGLLKMDYMIANIPGEFSSYPVTSIAQTMTPAHVASLQKSFAGGFTYIKAHTGWKFYLANLEIEVLTTWEDLNPLAVNNTNDTNTVLRFTMTNQDAPSAAPVTSLWTGDANRWQSRYLCAMFGSYLKSDMVSVGHHGNAGCEVDFYDTVKPTTVWWPHNESALRTYLLKPKSTGFQYEVDQFFTNELDSVHYVFASGTKTKGSDYLSSGYYTTLRLGVNGPDYDNIYDVMVAATTGSLEQAKIAYSVITGGATDYNISACMKK